MRKKRLIFSAAAALIAAAFGCGGPYVKIPDSAELGKEYAGGKDDEIAKRTLELTLNSLKKKKADNPDSKVLRDAHPKHHGCTAASFTVEKDIPETLKHGIFKSPKTYSAYIRFSNGSQTPQADSIGDIRGMGIKLMGVEGDKLLESEKKEKTQDFLIINHPVLPVGDPEEYLNLFEAAFAGKAGSYFFGWNPFGWKLAGLGKVRAIRSKKISSMLEIRYWSTTPYQLGQNAVKYSAKACGNEITPIPDNPGPDYLKETMKSHLSRKEACFDFMVQVQKDPVKMPVEDPAVEWDEEVSPFVKVATVKIPVQEFDTPEKMNFCENLSFTPWHSLPDHRPIGGINRVRKTVYEGISEYRHSENKAPRKEPVK